MPIKISKVSVYPSRKINLGKYENATLGASMEMTLDPPVDPATKEGAKEIAQAYKIARAYIKREFKLQYEPYKRILNSRKETQ